MTLSKRAAIIASAIILPSLLMAHGDVTPQAMDTSALPDIGEEWLAENPYRDPAGDYWQTAIDIGSSGYNSNCARCHGLGVVSGGLAPDLRYLEASDYGDEWYLERFQHGMTQNGITKMPAFGEVLGQQAAWAIKTYIETRPDDGALDDHQDRLKEIRNAMQQHADAITSGADPVEFADEVEALKAELTEIANSIETGSGAPVADSIASRSVAAFDGTPESFKHVVDILTIGLSATE